MGGVTRFFAGVLGALLRAFGLLGIRLAALFFFVVMARLTGCVPGDVASPHRHTSPYIGGCVAICVVIYLLLST
jgi:hypothetical protein